MVSATRLTCEPFDKRDNAGDYQDPPEDHKNPTPSPLSPIALAKGEHHVHHRHPAAADYRKYRRCITTGEPFTHDNVNLLFAILAVRLNHHGVHCGVRLTGHSPHKVFSKHSVLLIV